MKMKVPFTKLHPNAVMPTYGSASAAGADLYALAEEEIGREDNFLRARKASEARIGALEWCGCPQEVGI